MNLRAAYVIRNMLSAIMLNGVRLKKISSGPVTVIHARALPCLGMTV